MVEKQKLFRFRNLMVVATPYIIPSKWNKEHLLDIVTRLTEGKEVKYITGGGQTSATKRRVLVYESAGTICIVDIVLEYESAGTICIVDIVLVYESAGTICIVGIVLVYESAGTICIVDIVLVYESAGTICIVDIVLVYESAGPRTNHYPFSSLLILTSNPNPNPDTGIAQ